MKYSVKLKLRIIRLGLMLIITLSSVQILSSQTNFPNPLPGGLLPATAECTIIFPDQSTFTLNLNAPVGRRGCPAPSPTYFDTNINRWVVNIVSDETYFLGNTPIGTFIVQNNPDSSNLGKLISLDSVPPLNPSFPATSFFDKYLIIDFQGQKYFNRDPIRVSAAIVNNWPPENHVYNSNNIVDFYDINNPNGPSIFQFGGCSITLGMAADIVHIPTLSQWGIIIFTLLLLTFGTIFIYRRQTALVGVSNMQLSTRHKAPLFVNRVFLKVLALMIGLAIVGFVAALWLWDSISTTDFVGTLVSAFILAYMVHLWVGMRQKR